MNDDHIRTAPPQIQALVVDLRGLLAVVDEMEGATAVTEEMKAKAESIPSKVKEVEKKLRGYKAVFSSV